MLGASNKTACTPVHMLRPPAIAAACLPACRLLIALLGSAVCVCLQEMPCMPVARGLQCRDPAAALSVFTEMKKTSRLQPDVVAYTSLLTALHGTPKASGHLAKRCWRKTKHSLQGKGQRQGGSHARCAAPRAASLHPLPT